MKYLLLVALAGFVSCSSIKTAILGYDFQNEIQLGSTAQEAVTKTGQPKFRLPLSSNKEILLFNTGYILVEDNKVIDRSKFQNTFRNGDKISEHIATEADLVSTISKLGCPREVVNKKDAYFIKYDSGAVFVNHGQVIGSSDKVYDDNLKFLVSVNAFRDAAVPTKGKYYISSGDKSISEDDLLFREAKDYLSKSVSDNGFEVVDNLESADFVLLVQFGISDPQERVDVVSTPVYLPQYNQGSSIGVFSGGSQIGTLKTSGSWSTAYAGQSTQTVRTVSYSRWLSLHAFDYKHFKKTGKFNPVWKTESKSTGESGDIRFILPGLVLVAQKHLAVDTQLEQNYRVLPESANRFVYDSRFEKAMKLRSIASKQ